MGSFAAEPGRDLARRGRQAGRSAEVKALTALLCGAALCLAAGVAFPMSHQAPRGLGLVMLGVAVALAGLTFAFGDRVRRGTLLGGACLIAGLNTVLVAAAHTTGGAVVDAFAYLWLAIYVAVFFPAWWAGFAVLVTLAFGAGLIAAGLPGMLAAWVVFAVSVITTAGVLAHVSRMLRGRADTDDLTGTLNRGGLDAAAERINARQRRSDRECVSVAVLDLDDFKAVNDTQGHATGDRLLSEAANAWRSALRGTDVLARSGGDEFVLLMPGTDRQDAAIVLKRLREAHPIDWSAGVAEWQPDEPLQDCLERADRELYAIKHGR